MEYPVLIIVIVTQDSHPISGGHFRHALGLIWICVLRTITTDGDKAMRTIQTLEDMLRACAIDFGKGWVNHLPLVEFLQQLHISSIKAAHSKPLLSKVSFPLFVGPKWRSSILATVVIIHSMCQPEKCHADEPLAVPLDGLHLDDKLHFVEEPLEIVGREVKRLKRSQIPLVKVRWNSKRGPEFTWEREDQFKKKYPHLFTKSAPSSSAAS
ncbi:hypothetical protein Tco_0045674 [Tanacetum coccineum]